MFHKIVQSAIEKGRLKFVETQIVDQSIQIGLDGPKLLHRLLQADSPKVLQVHTEDGFHTTSEGIVQEHVKGILQGEHSIEATPKTSSTWGQQENS